MMAAAAQAAKTVQAPARVQG